MYRLLGLVLAAAIVAPVAAQTNPPTPAKPPKPTSRQEEIKIPERERLALMSKDGFAVACDFYPGGYVKMGENIRQLDGKSVVPLILVHGWGGRGSDFEGFASAMQMYGYAVAVPDLRGHGRSTSRGGVPFDVSQMNPREIQALLAGMVEDVDTVKRFLLQKNNEGAVNIELLGVLGAEAGALVAMNWAAGDWNKQSLPAYKQGKDVKVMVYLSPPEKFRNLSNRLAINHAVVAGALPTMIAVGANDAGAMREADRLYRLLEKKHPNPAESLKFLEANTSLQGVQMLQGRGLPVAGEVLRFFYQHLNERSNDFPWADRPNPLGGE